MLHLPITASQLAELHDVIRVSHRARSRAAILTSDHRVLVDRRSWLLDGQVEIDVTAEVTRSAAATILDPEGQSGLDVAAPQNGSTGFDRFLQLRRDIWLPHARIWVSVPMFTGPVTGVSRAGPVIEIEAQGKELLAMQPIWTPKTYKKGTKRIAVLEDLMRTRAGEFTFAIPQGWGNRTGSDWNLTRRIDDEAHTVWARAKQQARLLGADMFYDARGTLRLRRRGDIPVWDVPEDCLAAQPTASSTTGDIKNTVVVTGGTPSGGSKPIEVTRTLPASHPWSASALGRRGVGRRLAVHIEDSSLVTAKDAVAVAERELRQYRTGQVDIECSMLPFPFLEPYDLITVDLDGHPRRTRLHKASWSMTGELMTYGHLRNYHPRLTGRR